MTLLTVYSAQLKEALRRGAQNSLSKVRSHRALERDLLMARRANAHLQQQLLRAQHDADLARHQAHHDELTSLPNRRHFHMRIADALSASRNGHTLLAVLYLDLNDFKRLNDVYGHETGDAVLKIVARRLLQDLRGGDAVCRMGGDEFACLLVGFATLDQIRRLAAHLHRCIAAPIRIGGQTFHVAPSMGIAQFPQDGSSADTLIRRADLAMYAAKRAHLPFVCAE